MLDHWVRWSILLQPQIKLSGRTSVANERLVLSSFRSLFVRIYLTISHSSLAYHGKNGLWLLRRVVATKLLNIVSIAHPQRLRMPTIFQN
jgi:hypothetical protein